MLYLGVLPTGGLTDQAQHSLKCGYIMQLAGCVVWPLSANNPDSCPSRGVGKGHEGRGQGRDLGMKEGVTRPST